MNNSPDVKENTQKKDDPEQSKLFMEMAEELDCDHRVRPFEKILSKWSWEKDVHQKWVDLLTDDNVPMMDKPPRPT